MFTVTAIIKAKKGHEGTMKEALLDVATHVNLNEPETISFYISQDLSNPCLFTTYERFGSEEAQKLHSSSEALKIFFDIALPILDGEVILATSKEISAKVSPDRISSYGIGAK